MTLYLGKLPKRFDTNKKNKLNLFAKKIILDDSMFQVQVAIYYLIKIINII
jgi:hypothetical protein